MSPRQVPSVADINVGDILIADASHACIDAGTRLPVQRQLYSTDLFVACIRGRHYLNQIGTNGCYHGFRRAEPGE
jgi:hypothetical protein